MSSIAKQHVTLPPYVGGKFLENFKPEKTYGVPNPSHPNDILAVIGWNKDLVPTLINSAKQAQSLFKKIPLSQKLAMLQQFSNALIETKDELTSLMMLELGRTITAVDEEWRLCLNLFTSLEPFCLEALSAKVVKKDSNWCYAPVGLVLISTNVSLPIFSLLSAALTSLAAGNAVCLKPSVHCPLSTSLLASVFHQCNFPKGLIQIVYGDFEVFRRLALSNQFQTVHCTGGEEMLEQVRRDLSSNQNARLVLCGGGKNASIITQNAYLPDSVEQILYGATVDCGQRLASTGLVFVHSQKLNEFVEMFVSQMKQMPIQARPQLTTHFVSGSLGSAEKEAHIHSMGPLCSAQAWERFLRFQGIAARECSETLRWGKAIDNPGGGYFVSPGCHIMNIEKVDKSVYASNAFFGPDVCLVPYENSSTVTDLLGHLQSARTVSVHSESSEDAISIRNECDVPNLVWNKSSTHMDVNLPRFGRGKAGNAYATGLRFLFQTVFPVSLNLSKIFLAFIAFSAATLHSKNALADYRKAVEGNEVVKGKLYPKSGRFQLNVGGGGILNQSFVNTYLMGISATYHFNEWHALNLEAFYGISTDKGARECVENFYYDTKRTAKYDELSSCNPNPSDANTESNAANDEKGGLTDDERADYAKRKPFARKPAFMPIRQIDLMALANYQWTPVYGKALWFLSSVGYLDFFVNLGAGLAFSTVWPLQTTFKVGTADAGKEIKSTGTSDPNAFGKNGRPDPVKQTSPLISLGLGSRFFFAKYFLVNADFRNITLIGSNPNGGSDISNFFAIWGGMGMIF